MIERRYGVMQHFGPQLWPTQREEDAVTGAQADALIQILTGRAKYYGLGVSSGRRGRPSLRYRSRLADELASTVYANSLAAWKARKAVR